MAYRVEDLLADCASALGAPSPAEGGGAGSARRSQLYASTMSGITQTAVDGVWNSVLQCIRSNMKMHKGTKLQGFGRMTFAKGTKAGFFVMSEAFTLPSKIKFRAAMKAPELVCVELNFSKIAQLAKCTKDIAKTIYRELISRLGEVLSDANNVVDVYFKGVGSLVGNRFDLRFRVGERKKIGRGRSGPRTAASFTKEAPSTAAGLAVVTSAADIGNTPTGLGANVSQVGPEVPPALSLSARSGRSNQSLAVSASAPQLHKGLAVSAQIKSQKSKAAGQSRRAGRKPRLNRPAAKKGYPPTYDSFDETKELNLMLMRNKEEKDAKARQASEKEFRDKVLRLHAEATRDRNEERIEQARHEEFAEVQAEHARRVEARKFAERNAEVEDNKEHWPFTTEEDVRRRAKERTTKMRDILDEQVEEQHKLRGTVNADESRPLPPDPLNKDTWPKQSEGNIYPKFLTPSLIPSRIAGKMSATPVMKLGYQRYADELKRELEGLQRQERQIHERQAAADKERMRRQRMRREVMAKTIAYQSKQAKFDRERRKMDHTSHFMERDPDPARAYPVEKLRDTNRLDRIKAGLRNALDSQVYAKNAMNQMKKTIETAEDNYFLGCVQEQLEVDRSFRAKKRADEQRSLMQTWKRQEDMNTQIRKMQKMRDGLVVRNGSKVETINDVSRKYAEILNTF